jgi:transcription-repair coupling factor (superfamily II helicase)
MAASPQVGVLARALRDGKRLVATGSVGSSTAGVVGALAGLLPVPIVLVTAHLDDAEEAEQELVGAGVACSRLPALPIGASPGSDAGSAVYVEAFAERLRVAGAAAAVAERLAKATKEQHGTGKAPVLPVVQPSVAAPGASSQPAVFVCAIAALMQLMPPLAAAERMALVVRAGRLRERDGTLLAGPQALAQWLATRGYRRSEAIEEPGDFSLRGGLLDVFPIAPATSDASEPVPLRVEFFGDEVERVMEIDRETLASDRKLDEAQLFAAMTEPAGSASASKQAAPAASAPAVSFLELLPRECVVVLAETLEVVEQGRGYFERVPDGRGIVGPPAVLRLLESRFAALVEINQFSSGAQRADERIDLAISPLPAFSKELPKAIAELAELASGGRVLVACHTEGEHQRLQELLSQHAPQLLTTGQCDSAVAYVHRGFVAQGVPAAQASLAIVPFHEMVGRFAPRRSVRQVRAGRTMDTFLDFQEGDYVVHVDHGIARYLGLTLMRPRELPSSDAQTQRRIDASRQGGGTPLAQRADLKNGLKNSPKNGLKTSQTKDQPSAFDSGAAHRTAQRAADRTAISAHKGTSASTPQGAHAADHPREPELAEDAQEYLVLEFASSSRLYVPAVQVDLVQKYVGGFAGKPPLSMLGGQRWKAQKDRVFGSVKDLAAEMLRVRAAREHLPGVCYPHDTAWQGEFEGAFPHELTPDQAATLQELKRDMQANRPMDRLICGDVGFGKTELAIRAAFKAVEFGKQVAVLVPTTVLCEQHERTFKARFAGFPFRIESVSRFKTDAQVRSVLSDLRRGAVDVIVGTHRLLSQDVVFNDLGLVVIDEEQRFGVEHKEQLLKLRMTVDVLTLSATPIPRTLHMAMLGIRDISSLTTPPADRRAIVTEVTPYNAQRIRQAIARELAREGQIYFVHNRISDLQTVADDVRRLSDNKARVVHGHGQMDPSELEEVMLKFMRREADILVSTTIIESGIDISTANTMIINDADRFGLSELHQLRGRVGRSKERAYCYLLLPEDRPVKDTATKRLRAIEQFSMLGAGFKIAMRDLEIRGAGNILGPEQSGHIAAVGYEMYCQLLEQAAHELKNEAPPLAPSGTSVEIGVVGVIAKTYIPSDQRRLGVYRRLALASTTQQLHAALGEVVDAYGQPPQATQRLFDLVQLRLALAERGVRSAAVREKDVVFHTTDPQRLATDLQRDAPRDATLAGSVTILPPSGDVKVVQGSLATSDGASKPKAGVGTLPMVYFRPPTLSMQPATLLLVLRKRLGLLGAGGGTLSGSNASEQAGQAAPGASRLTPVASGTTPGRKPPPRGVRSRPVR